MLWNENGNYASWLADTTYIELFSHCVKMLTRHPHRAFEHKTSTSALVEACCFRCWWDREIQARKAELSHTSRSLKAYQTQKHCTLDYNTVWKDLSQCSTVPSEAFLTHCYVFWHFNATSCWTVEQRETAGVNHVSRVHVHPLDCEVWPHLSLLLESKLWLCLLLTFLSGSQNGVPEQMTKWARTLFVALLWVNTQRGIKLGSLSFLKMSQKLNEKNFEII